MKTARRGRLVCIVVVVLSQMKPTYSKLKRPRLIEMNRDKALDAGRRSIHDLQPDDDVVTEASFTNILLGFGSIREKTLNTNRVARMHTTQLVNEPDQLENRPSAWAFGFDWNAEALDCEKSFGLRALPGATKQETHPFSIDLINRNDWCNGIMNFDLQNLWEKRDSIASQMSPAASYFASIMSKSFLSKLSHEACFLKRSYGRCSIKSRATGIDWDKALGLSDDFLLPFFYQLLLKKPSCEQWESLENILAKFIAHWKLLFLLEPTFQVDIRSENSLMEKTAKMLMWISEVLQNSCVQDFMDTIKRESKVKTLADALESGVGKGNRRGTGRINPFAQLYLLLAASSGLTEKKRSRVGLAVVTAFLDRWQLDCHKGYPQREKSELGQGELKEKSRKLPPEADRKVWDTWCNSIVRIKKAAEEFELGITGNEKVSWISLGSRRLFELWVDFTSSNFSDEWSETMTKICSRHQLTHIKITSKMRQLLQEVPQEIKRPMGDSNSLEKLSFFFNLEIEWDSFQYLPDRLELFFNMDLFIGKLGMLAFEKSFQDNKVRLENHARFVRNSAKKKRKKKVISHDRNS